MDHHTPQSEQLGVALKKTVVEREEGLEGKIAVKQEMEQEPGQERRKVELQLGKAAEQVLHSRAEKVYFEALSQLLEAERGQ